MHTRVLQVPATKIDGDDWFLLSHFGKKHTVRFLSGKQGRDVPDPSGHRLRQMTLEGTVKWRPKEIAKINIKEVPALGPS